MCGIVGYVGREQAAPILLDGLSRLEYRGYDSAGVAVYHDGQVRVAKSKGRLQVLSDMIQGGRAIPGTIGIGHTRWATHGAPSDTNSHPHVSHSGKIAVVHNGIIENYAQLKSFLQAKGVPFVSETDSEVVAQLVEYFYEGDLLAAVGRVLHRIEGAYALGILCCDQPDQLIAVRKDSPLILGLGEESNFLASDVTAILRHTRDVIYMEDGEVAVLTAQGIQCYNSLLQPITKEVARVDWEVDAAEKGGYEHFMAKEIMEQPEALRRTIFPRIQDGEVYLEDFALTDEEIRDLQKLYIVACGSSYHVGMVGKYHLERLLRKPVEVALASEFRYMEPIVDEHTLVVVISQSGETLDTMAALREAKRLGAKVLAIVNVVGSSIARESDVVLYTWAGPEIAVATTKAYSTQLAVLNLLGLYFARRLGTIETEEYRDILGQMLLLPAQMEEVLAQKSQIQYLASQYFNHESIFFMGRNVDYALGLEGSLKLKEISYIHSEAYAAGELKHGTISLIEDGTLVVAVGTYGALFDKALSNVVEVKSRGADVLALTTASHAQRMEEVANGMMLIPDTHPMLLPSLGVVPLQLFAYYVALHRGCDIDKPRNLAKSVTVE
ncbi:glutamine--fructose-6-phosphate transaminase (isomerizing) [Pseudoflavonifractor sp. An44]|uniref:glutamine--fructose-6-phosphate transaminase (isomerizing) n=1 Tax=unclassified Pseudoflavonifractor TaxID=2628103 RepID=UPI000B3AA9A0|nr:MULTISPECIES: glutamine--fructose-6-phosphate transaminase (isomerizing) [unclassified Pseudoflavonifractor]OUN98870.1 glutamine--fructose-6-phosphate transaminase (isomerizing) [Pseudoflavonifractor sp. An44]OUP66139.1 glutamine--fructose-6-phosphate transaminase (isomerizing) [Pseudoflavonifractor sp. An176]